MAGAQCRDEANWKAGASGTSGALIGPESWLEKGRGESEDERQRHDRGKKQDYVVGIPVRLLLGYRRCHWVK